MNNRRTYGMYSQFLIKKTPLGLFRKLQKPKRKEKNSKAGPPLCPQVPGPVTERKASSPPCWSPEGISATDILPLQPRAHHLSLSPSGPILAPGVGLARGCKQGLDGCSHRDFIRCLGSAFFHLPLNWAEMSL